MSSILENNLLPRLAMPEINQRQACKFRSADLPKMGNDGPRGKAVKGGRKDSQRKPTKLAPAFENLFAFGSFEVAHKTIFVFP